MTIISPRWGILIVTLHRGTPSPHPARAAWRQSRLFEIRVHSRAFVVEIFLPQTPMNRAESSLMQENPTAADKVVSRVVSRIWRGSRWNIRVFFCPIGKILIRRPVFWRAGKIPDTIRGV
jgi:hypothetical protein